VKKVITFGTFDLLHEGHLKILERAKNKGDYLIVGVSTDHLNASKGKRSILPQEQRVACVKALKYVDEVFLEESLELKDSYIKRFEADLLVMGDDWYGKFDWVSCDVKYLKRTDGISSSMIKTDINSLYACTAVMFGDTYIQKHYDCALTLINDLVDQNVAPILTNSKQLPKGINCDAIIYFNYPLIPPSDEYEHIPKILIDHGASHLKWFLANKKRFNFFDKIITAGPDHVKSLNVFFPNIDKQGKVRSGGFIKSKELISPSRYSRKEICNLANLDETLPIILFVPTWYKYRHRGIQKCLEQLSKLSNHVISLHPETENLDLSGVNIIDNSNGITLELLKHSDIVISDTSSTIYEAAAINKPVIQLILDEYSDNSSVMYDLPMTAGTAELFCGGLQSYPEDLVLNTQSIIANPSAYEGFFKAIRKRVLTGTVISETATLNIAKELSIETRRCKATKAADLDRAVKEGLEKAHQYIDFSKTKLIGHGGTRYKNMNISNSVEAISHAFNKLDVVEIDVVQGLDGPLIAHDSLENKYGLNKKFEETTQEEFSTLKYEGCLNTISVDELLNILKRRINKKIIVDIKEVGAKYEHLFNQFLNLVKEEKLLERVVFQVYCKDDFDIALKAGGERVILAVWKYFYKDPLGVESFNFIQECIEVNSQVIVGVSIPYNNKYMALPSCEDERLLKFYSFWKRIYLHGAPYSRYPEILRKNLGLFIDVIDEKVEFSSLPNDFNWITYLFLNSDLVDKLIRDPISAMRHYLKFGEKEKRKYKYVLPDKFSWQQLLLEQPTLRKLGVGNVNSVNAYITNIEQKKK